MIVFKGLEKDLADSSVTGRGAYCMMLSLGALAGRSLT